MAPQSCGLTFQHISCSEKLPSAHGCNNLTLLHLMPARFSTSDNIHFLKIWHTRAYICFTQNTLFIRQSRWQFVFFPLKASTNFFTSLTCPSGWQYVCNYQPFLCVCESSSCHQRRKWNTILLMCQDKKKSWIELMCCWFMWMWRPWGNTFDESLKCIKNRNMAIMFIWISPF